MMKTLFLTMVAMGMLTGCQSLFDNAKKEAKYSAYEWIGVEKRDLFKREVKNVKEGQEETGEAFTDALDKLQKIYAFDGGNLERQYRSLNSSYEDAKKEVENVQGRIRTLETVAQDLFKEWRKEIEQMKSADLKSKSQQTLRQTENKYREFHRSLKNSENRMDPVLAKLQDHVLFLKHNLNAKAIAGLKTESSKIQNDIEALIKEMNASIKEADDFIKTM